jgi:Branched-chain amino acid ABC-type transport system, permease components
MMLGGFFAFTFIGMLGLNYWIGFAGAVLAMALFGMLAERVVVRPILGYPQFSIIMATIGLGYFLRSVVGMIWGTDDFKIETPFSQGVLRIGSLVLAYDKLSVIAATVILCALLICSSTAHAGTAMRASSENMLAPITWASGQARGVDRLGDLGGGRDLRRRAAGADHLHSFQCRAGAGPEGVSGRGARRLRLDPRAVVGGVLIGVIESMAGFYLPQGWKDVAPYIVLSWCCCSSPKACSAFTRKKV